MKFRMFTFLLAIILFSACSNTKQIIALQDNIKVLEKELSKQKYENSELRSFRASLEDQFKKHPSVYIKVCQVDDSVASKKYPIEQVHIDSLFARYSRLIDNYNKLQRSCASLKESFMNNQRNSMKIISDLQRIEKQKLNKKRL